MPALIVRLFIIKGGKTKYGFSFSWWPPNPQLKYLVRSTVPNISLPYIVSRLPGQGCLLLFRVAQVLPTHPHASLWGLPPLEINLDFGSGFGVAPVCRARVPHEPPGAYILFSDLFYFIPWQNVEPGYITIRMKEIIEVIQSVGFPIVIALLFYIDLRKVIRCNTQAIKELAQVIYQKFKWVNSGNSF